MDRKSAITQARFLMDKHGLEDWGLHLTNAKTELGHCDHRRHRIALSRYMIDMNDWGIIADTVLHEIAHARVGSREGHGRKWRIEARRIGARPDRIDTTAKMPTPKWRANCPCQKINYVTRHRKPRSPWYCSDCWATVHWSENS